MDENFGKKIIKSGQKSGGKFKKMYYTIKSQMNNDVIDLKGDQKDKNGAVSCKADGGMSQTFAFIREGFDFYIKNKQSALYLTLDSDENGAHIYGDKKQKGNKRQLFRIQKKDNEDVIFIRTFCDKVLEMSQGGQGKGSYIVQWKFNENTNQQFRLVEPHAYNSSTDEGESLYETKQGYMQIPEVTK